VRFVAHLKMFFLVCKFNFDFLLRLFCFFVYYYLPGAVAETTLLFLMTRVPIVVLLSVHTFLKMKYTHKLARLCRKNCVKLVVKLTQKITGRMIIVRPSLAQL
jgi:hypothetical protein